MPPCRPPPLQEEQTLGEGGQSRQTPELTLCPRPGAGWTSLSTVPGGLQPFSKDLLRPLPHGPERGQVAPRQMGMRLPLSQPASRKAGCTCGPTGFLAFCSSFWLWARGPLWQETTRTPRPHSLPMRPQGPEAALLQGDLQTTGEEDQAPLLTEPTMVHTSEGQGPTRPPAESPA